METFADLGLSSLVLNNLEKAGIRSPTEIQEKSIPLVLDGHDVLGASATGSGKTFAFGIPIIEKMLAGADGGALILTPTRELADQIVVEMRKIAKGTDLNIVPIYGGVSIEPQVRKLENANIVVATPGRLLDHLRRGTIGLDSLNFLVLDEVDRMFDMGFYQDVEAILNECSDDRLTMMFSATMSGAITHFVDKYTKNRKEVSVQAYVDRSKLTQVYYDVDSKFKFSLLVHLLRKEAGELVMVFCSTRKMVDVLARQLPSADIRSIGIHGGLSQHRRSKLLEKFNRGDVDVLVCTDVAARGLDIKGVSHVYNYDLPKVADDYVHRIGRTARAGTDGKAISLVSNRDYEHLQAIVDHEHVKLDLLALPEFEVVRFSYGDSRSRDSGRHGGRASYGKNDSGKRRGGSRGDSSGRGRRDSGSRGSRYSSSGGRSRSDSSGSRRRGTRSEGSRGRSRSSSHGDGVVRSKFGRRGRR